VKNETQNENSFRVNSLKDLTNIIIPHFQNILCWVKKSKNQKIKKSKKKAADFYLFKQVTELMTNKAHLTTEGLQKIINLKANMNLGLSEELKSNFINTVPVQKQKIKTTNIPDSN
jgi:hypothetical protein